MIDADNFKSFNDTYGHHIRDDVLKLICKTSQIVPKENDLLGRIGGEKFVFHLPETNIDSAIIIAERIRHVVENAFIICDKKNFK